MPPGPGNPRNRRSSAGGGDGNDAEGFSLRAGDDGHAADGAVIGTRDDLWVPKTYATWADALGIAVGSVKRLGVGRAGLGSAGGGMIFGLWA